MVSTVGEQDLRKEYIDGAVKAVALAEYKLKTLCTIETSNSWTETYYRETNTELTGGTGSNVRAIPRLAPFPYAEVSWTKVQAIIQKYGMEGVISYEDENLNNISVVSREVLRIGRAVAYAIDSVIAAAMLANAANSVTIAAGNEWDSATEANRNPLKDIADAIQTIRADNLDALNGNGYLCLNGTDYTNLITNTKITNSVTYKAADIIANGVMGQIMGLKIMVTEALEVTTPDVAYIVIANEAMTWKEAMPLRIEQIVEPMIRRIIRAGEMGVCQVQSPNAIAKITNTRK